MPRTLRSSKTAKAPVLRNLMDIKGTLPEGALIHFTAEQWKQMTQRLERATRLPKHGVVLAAYPLPDGSVVGQPDCISEPCQICRGRISGIGPGGIVMVECLCRPDPSCPQDPPSPSAPACRLEITRFPRIRIGCARVTCTRRCRLQIVQQGWRWVIVCACS